MARRCMRATSAIPAYHGPMRSFASSIVCVLAERLLASPNQQETDPVIGELENGRRRALELVKSGTE